MPTKKEEVHVPPEKLREFAGLLSHYAARVEDCEKALTSGVVRLGDTFRDEGFRDFKDYYSGIKSEILRFVEEIRKVVPRLNTAAANAADIDRVKIKD